MVSNGLISRDTCDSCWGSRGGSGTLALTNAGTLASTLALAGADLLTSTLTSASEFARSNDICAYANALAHASALTIDLAHTCILTIASIHTSDLARIRARVNKIAHAGNVLAHGGTNSRDLACNLASDLAYVSTLIFDLDCTKEQRTTYVLDLALLLALLSICASFSAHELFVLTYEDLKESKPPVGVQEVLHKGINIYQRLERLKKRRQGEELACEGILIVKERKHDKTVFEAKKEM
jgi:hypothetical protein